jgi:hypothetical protein
MLTKPSICLNLDVILFKLFCETSWYRKFYSKYRILLEIERKTYWTGIIGVARVGISPQTSDRYVGTLKTLARQRSYQTLHGNIGRDAIRSTY